MISPLTIRIYYLMAREFFYRTILVDRISVPRKSLIYHHLYFVRAHPPHKKVPATLVIKGYHGNKKQSPFAQD